MTLYDQLVIDAQKRMKKVDEHIGDILRAPVSRPK
jgi:hypothetical protein